MQFLNPDAIDRHVLNEASYIEESLKKDGYDINHIDNEW